MAAGPRGLAGGRVRRVIQGRTSLGKASGFGNTHIPQCRAHVGQGLVVYFLLGGTEVDKAPVGILALPPPRDEVEQPIGVQLAPGS